MQSLVVIKHGDTLQNVLLCFIAGLVMSPLATFLLEAAREAFRHCIIPTIPQATHAANKTIGFQQIAVMWPIRPHQFYIKGSREIMFKIGFSSILPAC